ncbi:hypothetical protein R70723_20460 [Paenibacillus sp. FSL R7-0273]|uniref:hypothetical protein n=1 Tax=Paenibacillus sp. FSL R7-0273 TaxID=1536772 RepID=UPI0004F82868|nr:hypothetical protein [Paenibacillus sp. FSL R7-0273]AIQ48012.1 hypothetical protein R70723_20460 [Paenibacillus sp. FSL R7-0273]OMF94435.1 hypothetical protein BK144_07845 [Paenibacillus sp. FSL R7-0273]
MKKWTPLLVFCLLAIGIMSYSKLKVSEIASIRLECADFCEDGQIPAGLFADKTFTEPKEIKVFVTAINKAKRMKGELDYGVMFRMYAAYKNGGEKVYTLNIADSKKEGIRGLLVDSKDSGKGYSIPSKNHEELRKLIYGETTEMLH